MFRWTDDMIRYMADAGRQTDFHRRLTAELLPYLSPQDRVCDAGCGLGFLSLALAPHVRHVTAADCNAQALSVLKEELAARHIENVTPLCTDIFTDRPAEPYDAMVFCFFGHIKEILAISAAQCRGTVLAVMRSDAAHRFSAAQPAIRRGGYFRGREELEKLGVPFQAKEMELPMGQPFRTLSDARRFFELYRQPDDTMPITDSLLQARLTATGREDFPFYLPQSRRFGLLRWHAGTMPERPTESTDEKEQPL